MNDFKQKDVKIMCMTTSKLKLGERKGRYDNGMRFPCEYDISSNHQLR